jgi:hypothetical protein
MKVFGIDHTDAGRGFGPWALVVSSILLTCAYRLIDDLSSLYRQVGIGD